MRPRFGKRDASGRFRGSAEAEIMVLGKIGRNDRQGD